MFRIQTYKLHPTPLQIPLIRARFAAADYAYNWGLNEAERVWKEEHKRYSNNEIQRAYRHHVHYELKRPVSRVETDALNHLDFAYTQFFKGTTKAPRLKEDGMSFSVAASDTRFDYKHRCVKLPLVGKVRCNLYKPLDGKLYSVTVKQQSSGVFWLSVIVETPDSPKQRTNGEVVGIDLGVKHFATLSSGETIDFPEHIWNEKACRRQRTLQRRIARCEKGSKRYEKARRRLARFEEHKANQRKDFHCKTACALTGQYGIIAVETLSVEGMKGDHRRSLHRNLEHYGLRQFVRRLECRCQKTGVSLLKVGRFEPTSKTCHVCGHILQQLPLSVREWTCPECGTHHDRDINAAINIKTLGLRMQQTLPDVDGEVKPVEHDEMPCAEPGKAVEKSQPTCVEKSRKHNVARLAVAHKRERTITVKAFIKMLYPFKPERIAVPLHLSRNQLLGIKDEGAFQTEWRNNLIRENSEQLCTYLADGLKDALPNLQDHAPDEYVRLFNERLKSWFVFSRVAELLGQQHPYISQKTRRKWHLFVLDVIDSLKGVKVI